jgi:hypothetical protein
MVLCSIRVGRRGVSILPTPLRHLGAVLRCHGKLYRHCPIGARMVWRAKWPSTRGCWAETIGHEEGIKPVERTIVAAIEQPARVARSHLRECPQRAGPPCSRRDHCIAAVGGFRTSTETSNKTTNGGRLASEISTDQRIALKFPQRSLWILAWARR